MTLQTLITHKAKVLEIFDSIQGEGIYAGVKQIFVRFFECNMHCVWCDTPHSIGDTSRHYQELSLEEVSSNITARMKGCHSVSLTGGEPLMQVDFIKRLIPLIHKMNLKVYLETNGILFEELKDIIDGVDIIAMDIKLPSSTHCQAYWQEHEEFLKVALKSQVFIKTVISNDTTLEDVKRAVQLVSQLNKQLIFILQPNTYDLKDGVMKKCIAWQDDCLKVLKDVRVMPQMHKFLKVR